jgi:hypothetical protein
MVRTLALAACAGLLALAACSPGYEAQATLSSLRVLAVKKSLPYAHPGDEVKLSVLLHDGRDPAKKADKVEVSWFSGCENPVGDAFAACFLQFPELYVPENPAGKGFEFSYTLKDDIISGRSAPAGGGSTPFGLSFVFFTACAGHLGAAPKGESFPVACFTEDGERVGSDGFVVGYSQIFAYDEIANHNPVITGFQIDDQDLAAPAPGGPIECIGDDCVALEQSESQADAPAPDDDAPECTTEPWCIERCTKTRLDDCPKHSVKALLDKDENRENDEVSPKREGKDILEQMWINYYVDESKLDGEIKLLQDATEDWYEKHGTKFFAPQKPGPFHVWAVAHDNRGGAEWIRVRLATREPPEQD